MLTLCATICPKGYRFAYGANDWEAVAEYGRTKYEWLKTFLALPHGILDHDTFLNVMKRMRLP